MRQSTYALLARRRGRNPRRTLKPTSQKAASEGRNVEIEYRNEPERPPELAADLVRRCGHCRPRHAHGGDRCVCLRCQNVSRNMRTASTPTRVLLMVASSKCVRLATQAESIEKRNKLLELARVWSDAALVEEQFATEARPLSPQVA